MDCMEMHPKAFILRCQHLLKQDMLLSRKTSAQQNKIYAFVNFRKKSCNIITWESNKGNKTNLLFTFFHFFFFNFFLSTFSLTQNLLYKYLRILMVKKTWKNSEHVVWDTCTYFLPCKGRTYKYTWKIEQIRASFFLTF